MRPTPRTYAPNDPSATLTPSWILRATRPQSLIDRDQRDSRCPIGSFPRRHQPQDFAGVAVRQHVHRVVQPLRDAANPRVEIREQTFFGDDAIVLEHETYQRLSRKRRHKKVAAPFRKTRSAVKRDPRWRDVRRPEVHRLLHPWFRGLVAVDWPAGVLAAVADSGKAVILPLLDGVDLVAAARAMLARP